MILHECKEIDMALTQLALPMQWECVLTALVTLQIYDLFSVLEHANHLEINTSETKACWASAVEESLHHTKDLHWQTTLCAGIAGALHASLGKNNWAHGKPAGPVCIWTAQSNANAIKQTPTAGFHCAALFLQRDPD
mmetsp:Transcript_116065/g.225889  ORF Transcript_116065/g.225889 Transcript_116065/m.225889 type:complete len:137 (-) Transcript_116065:891-1301(-)